MDDYVAVRMCGTADRVLPWLSGEKTVKAILLLGDDPDTCSTLQDLLRAERYHVVVASGWAVAARCMEKIRFALLVLDDPGLGVRGEPELPLGAAAMPPILALSGHRHAAASRGGVLLTKPFDLLEFLEAVRALTCEAPQSEPSALQP